MTTLQPGTQVEADPVDDYDVASKKYTDDAVGDHETSVTEGETGPTIGTRVGIRAAFVWWSGIGDNISGHGYYQVQMATDSGFASIVDDVETKTNWATFDGLTTGVTYYWRVRGIDAAGNTSDWATTVSDSGDQVVEDDLGDDSVSTVKIQDLAVDTAKIKNAAITTAKIGNAEITTAKIADAQITTAKIDDLAVTTAKIGNAQITTAKIANLAVDTAKIASAAITNAKIDNLAVTEGKIANLAVDTAKIKNLAVETLKIADLNVTIDKEASPVQTEADYDSDFGDASPTSATAVTSVTVSAPSWAGSSTINGTHVVETSQATANGILGANTQIAGANSNFNTVGHVASSSNNLDEAISVYTYARDVSIPGSTAVVNGRMYNTESSANYFSTLSTVSIHTR